jgi:large subunit ribosomal protein L18
MNLKKESGDKKTIAQKVGMELGKKALEKGIKEVFFDRGNYLYHGRVKALASGLRESGLIF